MTEKFKPGDRVRWESNGLGSTGIVLHVGNRDVVLEGGLFFDKAWAEENVHKVVDKRIAPKTITFEGNGPAQIRNALFDTQHNKDTVYHPEHYSQWVMEPIEFIAINNLPWWLANIIKYCMRFEKKDGLQDLRKARSYLDMKIRQLEGVARFWDKPVTEEREANGKK